MSTQEGYNNAIRWAESIKNGWVGDGSRKRGRVVRPPDRVPFTGFAVWNYVQGAFVSELRPMNGKPVLGRVKRSATVFRYPDYASAYARAMKIGPHSMVIYAESQDLVFIVG